VPAECPLVAPTVVKAVVVPVTEPQDEAGNTIVGPVIGAISMVASATMDGPAIAQMAMPPAPMRAPAATAMIGVCFRD